MRLVNFNKLTERTKCARYARVICTSDSDRRVFAFVTIRLPTLLSPCICVHSSRVPLCACVFRCRSAAAVVFGRLARENSTSNRCGSSNTLRARSLLAKLDVVLKIHGILHYIDALSSKHQYTKQQ